MRKRCRDGAGLFHSRRKIIVDYADFKSLQQINGLTFGDWDRDVELNYLIKMAFIPGFSNAAISAI